MQTEKTSLKELKIGDKVSLEELGVNQDELMMLIGTIKNGQVIVNWPSIPMVSESDFIACKNHFLEQNGYFFNMCYLPSDFESSEKLLDNFIKDIKIRSSIAITNEEVLLEKFIQG